MQDHGAVLVTLDLIAIDRLDSLQGPAASPSPMSIISCLGLEEARMISGLATALGVIAFFDPQRDDGLQDGSRSG